MSKETIFHNVLQKIEDNLLTNQQITDIILGVNPILEQCNKLESKSISKKQVKIILFSGFNGGIIDVDKKGEDEVFYNTLLGWKGKTESNTSMEEALKTIGCLRPKYMGKATLSRGLPTFWGRVEETLESQSISNEINQFSESMAAERTRKNADWNGMVDWLVRIISNSNESESNKDTPIEYIQLNLNEILFLLLFSVPSYNEVILNNKTSNIIIDLSIYEEETKENYDKELLLKKIAMKSIELLLKFRVFCYFKLLGWTVKDGIKYGTDFVLYKNGPGKGHSKHTVMILYSGINNILNSEGFKPNPTYTQILATNRVSINANKHLLLCSINIKDDNIIESIRSQPLGIFDKNLISISHHSLKRWVPSN